MEINSSDDKKNIWRDQNERLKGELKTFYTWEDEKPRKLIAPFLARGET